jgi:hypothetical protein
MPGVAPEKDDSTAAQDAHTTLDKLTWPSSGVALSELLTALQFLGTDPQRQDAVKQVAWDAATPGSLQVLKSGVTNLTKWWVKRAGVAGGAAGALATLAGLVISAVEPFRKALGEPIAVALVAGGALIGAATVLALATFVTGDLRARAQATAARTAARAQVAAEFLRTAGPPAAGGATDPAGAAGVGPAVDLRAEIAAAIGAFGAVQVRLRDDRTWVEALGMRNTGEGFQILLADGDWRAVTDVEQYTAKQQP